MKDEFNGELADRKAIYRLYPQAIPNVFTIDKKTGAAPPAAAPARPASTPRVTSR